MKTDTRHTDRHDLAGHVVYVIHEGAFHYGAVIPKGKGILRMRRFTPQEQADYPRDREAVVDQLVKRAGGGIGTVEFPRR